MSLPSLVYVHAAFMLLPGQALIAVAMPRNFLLFSFLLHHALLCIASRSNFPWLFDVVFYM